MADRVLVTGATGFVAGHCIAELLAHGYAVRATVRDLAVTGKRAHLRQLAENSPGTLEFVAADLDADAGWAAAVSGCDAVLHVASPFPVAPPADAQDLIRPAVDGTLRVLRACAESGTVRRVVLTSSIAAVICGHDRADDRVRTEEDWSIVERSPAYQQSKTLAERAAWDFVRNLPECRGLELVTLCPGMILGPLQRPEVGTSVNIVRRLLTREIPGVPRIGFAIVDVRDLATAHRLALETPAAQGNRYILAGDNMWMRDLARLLATRYDPQGFRVPTRGLPDLLMRFLGLFDPSIRLGVSFLGRREQVSADKARRDLGITLRPVEGTVYDTADSLVAMGVAVPREAGKAVERDAALAG